MLAELFVIIIIFHNFDPKRNSKGQNRAKTGQNISASLDLFLKDFNSFC